MRLKNDASTDTRFTSRCTARGRAPTSMPNTSRAAAVVQEQRREHAHERRLARAVLAEDGDALAPREREADAVQGGDAAAADAAAAAAVAADELLAQIVDFDGGCGGHAAPPEDDGDRLRAGTHRGAWGGALTMRRRRAAGAGGACSPGATGHSSRPSGRPRARLRRPVPAVLPPMPLAMVARWNRSQARTATGPWRCPPGRPLWRSSARSTSTLAAAGLVVLSPVLAALAAVILVEDGMPVLFRQERAGLDGEPFTILKFRTMIRDAHARTATASP